MLTTVVLFSVSGGRLPADSRADPIGLGQRYAICSAWWDYQFEMTQGRIDDRLPKTLYSRLALDLALALSDRDAANAWVEEHLVNLRGVRGGMLQAAYYQEARVSTYLCKKMVEDPQRFRQ